MVGAPKKLNLPVEMHVQKDKAVTSKRKSAALSGAIHAKRMSIATTARSAMREDVVHRAAILKTVAADLKMPALQNVPSQTALQMHSAQHLLAIGAVTTTANVPTRLSPSAT